MVAVTAERLIEGPSTPESDWRAWLQDRTDSTPSWTHWLPTQARLVMVAPHPDDELLACGALLALHADRGGDCLVVAVTDGEASHGEASQWGAARLAAARRAESAEGLSRLGLGAPAMLRLHLPDAKVGRHIELLVYRLKTLLRPGDVVVSTWRLDGHPDHDATGLAVAEACAARACAFIEAPVWMWHWALPGDPRVPWHRLSGVPLAPQVWARKQAALAAHRSQLRPRGGEEGPVLGEDILDRARRDTEYFFV